MRTIKIFILIISCISYTCAHAQDDKKKMETSSLFDSSKQAIKDTTVPNTASKKPAAKDTLIKQKHDPHKATIRSALIPGWGQAYNKQYWKIPIVYGALAVPTVTFIYNNKWYKKTKDAYTIVINGDTGSYSKIDPKLINPNTGLPLDASSLQYYRNAFRRDRDYSVLYFLIIWGVNVVDATVFGHLKDFDVSDDLSMHIEPSYNPISKQGNIGIAFNFKNTARKNIAAY